MDRGRAARARGARRSGPFGDPILYLNAAPGWKPNLGATPGAFAMTDPLDYAGVGAVR